MVRLTERKGEKPFYKSFRKPAGGADGAGTFVCFKYGGGLHANDYLPISSVSLILICKMMKHLNKFICELRWRLRWYMLQVFSKRTANRIRCANYDADESWIVDWNLFNSSSGYQWSEDNCPLFPTRLSLNLQKSMAAPKFY